MTVNINDTDTRNEIVEAIANSIIDTFPKKLNHTVIKLNEHKNSWELVDTILSAMEDKLQEISKFNEIANNSMDIAELSEKNQTINYMKSDYENKRVRIRGEEFYGRVIDEYASEVKVKIENVKLPDDELYFYKSEVEVVDE